MHRIEKNNKALLNPHPLFQSIYWVYFFCLPISFYVPSTFVQAVGFFLVEFVVLVEI